MNSVELKNLITSFIDVVYYNYQLYNDHINNKSKYNSNHYNNNGTPKVAQNLGYKANKDITSPERYRNLDIKTRPISSGHINFLPGINFLATGQTAKEGIYPYFCYDAKNDILYLNYGTSDTKKPKSSWSYTPSTTLTPVVGSPDSRTYQKWSNARSNYMTWNYDPILQYLDDVIDDYEITLGTPRTPRADGSVGSGTGNVVPPTGSPAPSHTPATPAPKTPAPAPSHPLNLILYGPPGTGKTYNTLFHALAIINNKSIDDLIDEKCPGKSSKDTLTEEEYKLFKDDFDKKVKEGQIVFTTFHQSMSYEDFIEGIKPNVEGDEMTYEVQDGIFKKLCKSASSEYSDVDFDKCYNDFVSKLVGRLKLKSSGGKEFYVDLNSKGNLNLYTTAKQNKNGVLTKEKIKLTYLGKEDYWKGYMMGVVKYLKDNYGLKDPKKVKKQSNYVLIIDEINRGNVAQIFGELITLIEPSKRLGNDEEMTATLPYSSTVNPEAEQFGVPKNLYIIGTMNTADRSVEALDTALRRRFSFKEMMPDKELLKGKTVCGVGLDELLETINKRIVALKDREHQIGHSYFMGHDEKDKDGNEKYPNKEEWLTKVFKDKIIPLLQEYFYGDYKKIYYVLGEGFVQEVQRDKTNIFPVKIEDDYEFDIPEKEYIIQINEDSFDINNAIEKLKVQS